MFHNESVKTVQYEIMVKSNQSEKFKDKIWDLGHLAIKMTA